MTNAAKHFDPQIGIDIHMYEMPPGPLPTAHISIVLDPFDYLPFIGATVQVAGVKRATAGTQGLSVHIPLGVWMPPLRAPEGPQFDDQIFMGSKTVLADGSPFSRLGMPVLDCSVVGMVPPFRLKKSAEPHMSMTLPTSVNLAIPDTVFVGGPPSIMEALEGIAAQLALAGLVKGLGKGLKALRETKYFKRAADALKTKYKKLFENMEAGFLKCKVLRAEPVDIRDGSVAVSHQDFSIPGRLPLSWTRNYSSSNCHDGMCGYGWQTPADFRLEIDADGAVLFFEASGATVFAHLPAAPGIEHAVTEFVDGTRLIWVQDNGTDILQVLTKDDLRYVFCNLAANVTPARQTLSLKIERIEDLCGNYWRFERVDGHLTRIVESGIDILPGRFIEVHEHDGKIHQLSLYDPATGLTHPLAAYKYLNRDMIAALDALNAARTFEYDRHHMVRHADRLGLSFYYTYDDRWRAIRAWGDHGLHDYRFTYNESLRETEVIDSFGYTSLIKFDQNNLPLCEIDPLGGVTVFEYDEVGRTTAVIDPVGLRTEFAYDERGNLLTLVQPDGSIMTAVFDEANHVVEIIDPLGQRWRQKWDERGLLLEQTTPMGACSRFEYDALGHLLAHVNPRGATTALSFDRYGNLLRMTDALGHHSDFEHDALGYLRRRTDPVGDVIEYCYDAKGRLLQVMQAAGGAKYEYDEEDRLIGYSDENGAQTKLAYFGTGQLAKRLQADGYCVEFLYDVEERLIGVVNQRKETYQIKFDELGRIVEEIDYWGQSCTYRYDAAGRLLGSCDPLGRIISYDTDRHGRITRKALPDHDHPGKQLYETFCYDKRGALVELRSQSRHILRKFDADGRLREEVQDGFRIENVYDEVGNRLLRRTSAGNLVISTFDLRNQIASVTVNDEPAVVIERDVLGRIVTEQLSSSVRRDLKYDPAGYLTAQTVLNDKGSLFETRYEYDCVGNQIRRSDSEQGINLYQYDLMGNLLRHTDPAGRVTEILNDPAGDRLRMRIHQAELKQVVGGEGLVETSWFREGNHDGMDYIFDRAGNLIQKQQTSSGKTQSHLAAAFDQTQTKLSWDANQRLIESCNNGQVTRYGYDPLGRRVFKHSPTHITWFFWDGDALLGEVTQSIDTKNSDDIWLAANVADLMAARRRLSAFKALHSQTREFVYYPDTFVPLVLIDRQVKFAKRTDRITGKKADFYPVQQVQAKPTAVPVNVFLDRMPKSSMTDQLGGLGGLGSLTLGKESKPVSSDHGGNRQARLAGVEASIGLGSGMLLGVHANDLPSPVSQPINASATAIGSRPEMGVIRQQQFDEKKNGGIFHYHNDPNGCPIKLTDSSGQVVWSASYAASGRAQQIHIQTVDNPIRLQGQYYDAETELHYNRNRYYDAHIGSFVSQDPIGLSGGVNPYQYAPNPVGWIDPLGLFSNATYVYSADGKRIESATATITPADIKKGSNTNDTSRKWARSLGCSHDDAGHVVGNQLGGRGGKKYVFPQALGVNRGAFAQWESGIAEQVKAGNVNADISVKLNYKDAVSTRPHEIVYSYTINGQTRSKTFMNPACCP
ncbi:RHS repeat-associated core domain-containing protein [Collimonas pratensis]|uniref:RHS repeat-associated core domain protein n=1 Tax=Collimonas pratensis TaxID=279113 RepID=A0A127Q814_9BURK|nr:RHS repeat-associated core domain-containing protein [Collimonas pratensis]AMP06164.1 RHS repeat-associated core domain protein [Collimonas pratensis]